jgi:hypothetical protein
MNDFSQRFIDALRNAEHAAVRAMADQAVEVHGGMRVSGRSPAGHSFYITTASGAEVTIGMGPNWHTHLDEFDVDPENEQPFANVIKFLVDLIGEQIIVVEWYDSRGYAGSQAQRRGEASRELIRANRRVTLSWAGSYDGETFAE